MASTARAYSYETERVYRTPVRPRPDIRVVPGGRPAEQNNKTASIITLARVLAIVFVLIAALGIAIVALNSATLHATIASNELSESISKARAEGTVLEVQKGALDSSSRMKQVASDLGMSAPTSTELIALEADIVSTNETGNLSLAQSVARASQAAS